MTSKETTILDRINSNSINASEIDYSFLHQNGPMIYAFTTSDVKDAVKIGYTDQSVNARINQ